MFCADGIDKKGIFCYYFFLPSHGESTFKGGEMSDYPKFSSKEIEKTTRTNSNEVFLMLLANATADEAQRRANGVLAHQPRFHESGWRIALETPQGIVGIWSCWLNNRFYIGYPNNVGRISDELIRDILGLSYAQHVSQVDAVAVEPGYNTLEFGGRDSREVFGQQCLAHP